MSDQDAYLRILVSLSDAMLDDTHWPGTSALIDEACGLTGNCLAVSEGPKDGIRVLTVGFYLRGQRHEDLERACRLLHGNNETLCPYLCSSIFLPYSPDRPAFNPSLQLVTAHPATTPAVGLPSLDRSSHAWLGSGEGAPQGRPGSLGLSMR